MEWKKSFCTVLPLPRGMAIVLWNYLQTLMCITINIKLMDIAKKTAKQWTFLIAVTAKPLSLVSISYWALSRFSPSVCNKGSCQPIRPLLKYGWRDERDEGLQFPSQPDALHPHLFLLISVFLTSFHQFRESDEGVVCELLRGKP